MRNSILASTILLSVFSYSQDTHYYGGTSVGVATSNKKMGFYYDLEAGADINNNVVFGKFMQRSARGYKVDVVGKILPIPVTDSKVRISEISALYGYNVGDDNWKFILAAGMGMQYVTVDYLNDKNSIADYREKSQNFIIPLEISLKKRITSYSYTNLKLFGTAGKYSYFGVGLGLGFTFRN